MGVLAGTFRDHFRPPISTTTHKIGRLVSGGLPWAFLRSFCGPARCKDFRTKGKKPCWNPLLAASRMTSKGAFRRVSGRVGFRRASGGVSAFRSARVLCWGAASAARGRVGRGAPAFSARDRVLLWAWKAWDGLLVSVGASSELACLLVCQAASSSIFYDFKNAPAETSELPIVS